MRRLHVTPPQQEKQARLPINRTITFTDGITAFAHDYNFFYFALSDIVEPPHSNGFHSLTFPSGVVMVLENTGRLSTKTGGILYEVINREALSHHGVDFTALIEELLTQEVITP